MATKNKTKDPVVSEAFAKGEGFTELLNGLFYQFNEAVIIADSQRCISYANLAAEELFGYPARGLTGKESRVLYADEKDFHDLGEKRYNSHSAAVPENYRVMYRRLNGDRFLGVTSSAPICSPDGSVSGFIGVIYPARSAEQSLNTMQRMHAITSAVDLDHDQRINALLELVLEHFNLKIAILSRIDGDDYTVENCRDLGGQLEPKTRFNVNGTYCLHTLSAKCTTGFHYVAESEIRDHPCYQNFQLESYIGTPIRVNNVVYGTVNFSSPDPCEPFNKDDFILMELLADTISYLLFKRISEQELSLRATTDELTGLINRRAVMERLQQVTELSQRNLTSVTVLAVDIDHFKRINDQWGHAAGDAALVSFAQVVSRLGRKTDFCGRVGGEEFLVVMPGADTEAGIRQGNRIRQRLAQSEVLYGTQKIALKVSIGVATLTGDETTESLLARADQALYLAKENGRDQVARLL